METKLTKSTEKLNRANFVIINNHYQLKAKPNYSRNLYDFNKYLLNVSNDIDNVSSSEYGGGDNETFPFIPNKPQPSDNYNINTSVKPILKLPSDLNNRAVSSKKVHFTVNAYEPCLPTLSANKM